MSEITKNKADWEKNFEIVKRKRHSYEDLKLTDEHGSEEVWVKKLRQVLESDIHKKPFGCKISNTHIKIGSVHLDTFFEVHALFSTVYWVSRFANWVYEKTAKSSAKKLLVGYETYLEPLLYEVKNKNPDGIDYCIYESPKFVRGNEKSDERFRGLLEDQKDFDEVIFICGISSTLSTFEQLLFKLVEKYSIRAQKWSFLSIVQVLPKFPPQEVANSGTNEFVLSQNKYDQSEPVILKITRENRLLITTQRVDNSKETVQRITDNPLLQAAKKVIAPNAKGIVIDSKQLVDVQCNWQTAEKCDRCFPDDPRKEIPLISTDETSLVPLQMINGERTETDAVEETRKKSEGGRSKKETNYQIDFFGKKGNSYKYTDQLLYGHIDDEGHHFQYYINPGELFNVMLKNDDRERFNKFCEQAQKKLGLKKENEDGNEAVNIIIAPTHQSNEQFPVVINRQVFNGSAHIISFDAKKIYRSNFETEFSHFSYFLEQRKLKQKSLTEENQEQAAKPIHFYYVDDQLISGNTFYRVKSLINSLMKQGEASTQKIFAGIFVILNRNSNDTKKNYIDDTEKFFSVFKDIGVPSIRSYGDTCHRCKKQYDARRLAEMSNLSCNEEHWANKVVHHQTITVAEAKELLHKEQGSLTARKERTFMRFQCENELWLRFRDCENQEKPKEAYEAQVAAIFSEVQQKPEEKQCEYLISLVKALSRPFLYYKENEKKVALGTLIQLLEGVLQPRKENNKCTVTLFGGEEFGREITFHAGKNFYSLVVVIVNSLAAPINSNYILRLDTIVKLCKCVENYAGEEYLGFGKLVDDGESYKFYSVLSFAIKQILCGISGEAKQSYLEKGYKEYETIVDKKNTDKDVKDIIEARYPEFNARIQQWKDKRKGNEQDTERQAVKAFRREYMSNYKKYKKLFDAIYLENAQDAADTKLFEHETTGMLEKYKKALDKIQNGVAGMNIDSGFRMKEMHLYYYNGGEFCFEVDPVASYYSIKEVLFEDENTNQTKEETNQTKEEIVAHEKEKIKNVFKELEDSGFWHEKEDFYILQLKHFDLTNVEKLRKQHTDKGLWDDAAAEDKQTFRRGKLLLKIVFEKVKENNEAYQINTLKQVRHVMQYRYRLSKELYRDNSVGAIMSAIQAKKSNEIFSTEKVQGHGGVRDFFALYEIVVKMMREVFGEDGKRQNDFLKLNAEATPEEKEKLEEQQERRFAVYKSIKVFMNKIIAFMTTKKWQEVYFGDVPFAKLGWGSPLRLQPKKIGENDCDAVNSILNAYLFDTTVTKQYALQIWKEELNANQEYNSVGKVVVNKCQNVKVQYLPMLMNKEYYENLAKYDVVWLLGYLDIMIGNVIKHCRRQEQISFEVTFSKIGKESYEFCVSNTVEEPNFVNEKGMTQEFFSVVMKTQKEQEEAHLIEKNDRLSQMKRPKSKYILSMGLEEETSKYKSKITVLEQGDLTCKH